MCPTYTRSSRGKENLSVRQHTISQARVERANRYQINRPMLREDGKLLGNTADFTEIDLSS